jgi:uncharacterized protein (TIGR02145 family)
MRKILLLATILILGFAACGARRASNSRTDEGVVIDGVRWATRNVGRSGTFTRNSENFGGYFTWYEAKNACPHGWRLPTREELESLRAAGEGLAVVNGVNGRAFGIAPNQIFLPAAGLGNTNCALIGMGYYWSSSASDAPLGWSLQFGSGGSSVWYNSRAFRSSVRCVAE